MRKLIVTNAMSLDAYYEGPGGDVMALFTYRHARPDDESFDLYNAERLATASTLLLGRNSYDGFRSFWPLLADHDAAAPSSREVSRRMNAIEKVVVSDTLIAGKTEPWTVTTRIVGRGGAHEEIAALKDQDGGDILVFASRTLWSDLYAAGLVDELHLYVGPAVLGRGTPIFRPDGAAVRRQLVGTRTWEGSDAVVLIYATGT